MKVQRYRLATRLLAIGVVLSWLGGAPMLARQARDPGGGRSLVHVAEVDALIQPVSAGFIKQVLDNADAAGADLVVLGACGHLSTMARPEAVTAALRGVAGRVRCPPAIK